MDHLRFNCFQSGAWVSVLSRSSFYRRAFFLFDCHRISLRLGFRFSIFHDYPPMTRRLTKRCSEPASLYDFPTTAYSLRSKRLALSGPVAELGR